MDTTRVHAPQSYRTGYHRTECATCTQSNKSPASSNTRHGSCKLCSAGSRIACNVDPQVLISKLPDGVVGPPTVRYGGQAWPHKLLQYWQVCGCIAPRYRHQEPVHCRSSNFDGDIHQLFSNKTADVVLLPPEMALVDVHDDARPTFGDRVGQNAQRARCCRSFSTFIS